MPLQRLGLQIILFLEPLVSDEVWPECTPCLQVNCSESPSCVDSTALTSGAKQQAFPSNMLPQVQVAPHLRLYLQESKQQDLQSGLRFTFSCARGPYTNEQ